MLLGIRTDSSVAEFSLHDASGSLLAEVSWQADRDLAHSLLRKLDEFLKEHGASFDSLSGLFVFRGPGSFTGLRIGIAAMNALAYARTMSIVGTQGDAWREDAIVRLLAGENDQVVMPHYGAEPRITSPRK